MEVLKNNVHISRKSGMAANQIFINEEVNVSEVNPQIANIVKINTDVLVENVIPRNEQVTINGYVNYNILYYTDDSDMVYGLEGMIPFEENIRVGDTNENSTVNANVIVDNTSLKLLNSRRFVFKCQLTANVTTENIKDIEFPEALQSEEKNAKEMESVSTLKEQVEALSIIADKVETFRIKDEIDIPNVKPAAEKIVWKDLKLKNITTKVMDGIIHIAGEIYTFIMYLPDDEGMPNQWTEGTLSFGGTIDMDEAKENMISYIDVAMQDAKAFLNENEDGEGREVSIDVVLGLKIKLYEEKEMEILSDVYCPYTKMIPVLAQDSYQKLLVKNASRTKSTMKIKLDQSKGNILQICNSGADVKIENITVSDNGLIATGKMKAYVMYISSNDSRPVCATEEEEEFTHRIDAEGITKEDDYYINWRVEQVNASMLSSTEIEVKAVVVLEAIVFKNKQCDLITEVNEEALDMEIINNLPGFVGYIVKDQDTLWKIAKNNYTTVDKIKRINNLQSDSINSGDRLLIVKSCKC